MSTIRIELLDNEDGLCFFDCDNTSINEQVRNSYFATIVKKGYAYSISLDNKAVGYYMLSLVSVENYSDRYDSGHFGTKFAALKIEYLAIAKMYQKLGFGRCVLDIIIKQAKDLCERIPIRYLTLDSLTEKVYWYKKAGFICYPKAFETTSSTTVMYLDFVKSETIDKYCDTVI